MKYSTLVKILLALAMVGGLIWLAQSVTWREFVTTGKRGFYSICTMAIFFYTACAIRAVAKYFQAKTDRLTDNH